MREAEFQARLGRKFTHTTDSNHGLPVAKNIQRRHFKPKRANMAWVSEISYVRTASAWLYLAAVLDWRSKPCKKTSRLSKEFISVSKKNLATTLRSL